MRSFKQEMANKRQTKKPIFINPLFEPNFRNPKSTSKILPSISPSSSNPTQSSLQPLYKSPSTVVAQKVDDSENDSDFSSDSPKDETDDTNDETKDQSDCSEEGIDLEEKKKILSWKAQVQS